MSPLPFGDLPPYRERRFVPADVNWEDWPALSTLYDMLEERAPACQDVPAFEQWLLDWEELSAALGEESTRRFIAMTTHTEDEEAEKAYLRFVEDISPRVKPRNFQLSKAYLAHPMRARLPKDRYAVLDRDIDLHVALFREENVPLETEEAKLGQQYQKLTGSLTVQFRGEERTLVQMGKFLEEPDRATRQEAWELAARRRLQEAPTFEEQFEEMLKLREQIARNAGFGNYRDFAFKERGRFDYTPDDCLRFHKAIETEIVPVARQLGEKRRQQLGVHTLRPWDTAVDPENRPPLKPFESVEILLETAQRIFDTLDPELAHGFSTMRDLKLLDLENRKGKAPGGYQSTLSEARLPFIFMNAVGLQRDVETLLHECGHAFHALACRDDDIYSYRHSPLEFGEVASMSMELLAGEHIEEFYSPEDARRARRAHLEGIVSFFPWMAIVDAFQHWIYTHPGHSGEERAAAFTQLMERFGAGVDWSGYEELRANAWHRQLHIFLSPFYYVEYGIAQIGALQIWRNSRRDARAALQAYKDALALGGSRPLPELFEAADARFRFDAATIRPLMEMIREELAKL